jgi:hypothetical protein
MGDEKGTLLIFAAPLANIISLMSPFLPSQRMVPAGPNSGQEEAVRPGKRRRMARLPRGTHPPQE